MVIKVGIIGTGWGIFAQMPGFRKAGMEVTALWSRTLEKAQKLCAEHGIQHAFDSFEDLANCDDVDLVCVATPVSARKEAVLAAVRAGKHVLAEKPFGLNAGEAQEMLEASVAEGPGKLYLCDFELRCVPAFRKMRAFIEDGDIGPVQFVTFSCLWTMAYLKDDAIFGHYNNKAMGGGVSCSFAPHFVDLCRYLFSQEVAKVSALERTLLQALPDHDGNPRAVTADGFVSAQLLMTDGTPVQITLSGRTPGPPGLENRMIIVGSSGTLVYDFATQEFKAWLGGAERGAEPTVAEPPVEGAGEFDSWAKLGTPELGRAIRLALEGDAGDDAAEMPPLEVSMLGSFYDAVHVQKVTDAMHLSADQNGAWIDIEY
uniref:Gfo/Idh/MocA-like oxidoreductase N-terminal domain-containing protein n=1 Tax=Phaeomonas parva TaxID=124430 RepID=A0A7S1U0T1_9STRA|mmetsp:Transcript_25673/g.80358  ORF Transcript_25673/g.80358 Transcript_25673/m.80358 type:complete len:372 (+) Transcript_25673:88-1203(+)|eukprot:CAMPEP_0118876088 /NCGR_PEP_ID=MMETSP1163-20130328/16916_1 /TAXON_ID=124430 /ORGANISM="Phaeomonas parva, Strain CCMP2877" /LENGTH=371 /DNA_ID=CAMNT_0006811663 /DNA_START=101 /DNA_END=1216 /DNA_ORIENTATION=-